MNQKVLARSVLYINHRSLETLVRNIKYVFNEKEEMLH